MKVMVNDAKAVDLDQRVGHSDRESDGATRRPVEGGDLVEETSSRILEHEPRPPLHDLVPQRADDRSGTGEMNPRVATLCPCNEKGGPGARNAPGPPSTP